MGERKRANKDLDDIEKARIIARQQYLFPQGARELCAEIGLNWFAALKLFGGGWLSFDPETAENLDELDEAELRFVGSMVTAGCNEDLLRHLMDRLNKPYSYDANRIYFNWAENRWRLLPEKLKPEAVFSEWINGLIEARDIGSLEQIRDRIQEACEKLRE